MSATRPANRAAAPIRHQRGPIDPFRYLLSKSLCLLAPVPALIQTFPSRQAVFDALSRVSIAHLACHGIFEPDRPDASGIMLTPTAGSAERVTSCCPRACTASATTDCSPMAIAPPISPERATCSPCRPRRRNLGDYFVEPGLQRECAGKSKSVEQCHARTAPNNAIRLSGIDWLWSAKRA